ncbi:hypothetical protein [Tumebacillus lipolyticus]|uniref:Uncharacterized protein n=1 Tax=Tumebacillus lipolyticus TaxID=1280370 RepID=A0ABW5A3N4_9BACL
MEAKQMTAERLAEIKIMAAPTSVTAELLGHIAWLGQENAKQAVRIEEEEKYRKLYECLHKRLNIATKMLNTQKENADVDAKHNPEHAKHYITLGFGVSQGLGAIETAIREHDVLKRLLGLAEGGEQG